MKVLLSIFTVITLGFGLLTGNVEAKTESEHSRFSIAISGGASKGALTEVGPEQVEVIRLEMTVLENLKRIHTHLKRIAQEIVPQEIRG
jgi:uncharacterized spore protein YtfJ